MTVKLYSRIASLLQAMDNCSKSGNLEWRARHQDKIDDLIYEHFPHGSGFDMGTKLDYDKSTPEKLLFIAPFHHMNSNGFYCGWSDHVFKVTPSLAHGFNLKVSNPDRAKSWDMDYFHETFDYVLNLDVEY